MIANEYDIGDVVRISGTFTSTGGAFIDPTTVTVWVKAPSSTVYVTTAPTNPSTGVHYVDYTPASTGVYLYRIYSTGTVITAEEGLFRVRTPFVAST